MGDREKVIEELTEVHDWLGHLITVGYHGDIPDYRERKKAVADALAMLKEQEGGGWISVKDRLPEKDGKYLVYIYDNRRGYYKLAAFSTDKTKENSFLEPGYGWNDYDCDYGFYEVRRVTHWMPLPEPPEEVSGDADTH